MDLSSLFMSSALVVLLALLLRIVYNLYLHPLSKFPGPWYAASFSLPSAILSVLDREPDWLLHVARKYGKGDLPIRIAPSLLLFPKPAALKDIYWDPKNNTKGGLYGTGALAATHLFTILNGEEHRVLRKALGGAQWGLGAVKTLSAKGEPINMADKLAQSAADVMTMVSFSEPWGFVGNSRDERQLIQSFREGLRFFGFAGRFRWFREVVLKSPLAPCFLPKMSDKKGNGYLALQADLQVREWEKMIKEFGYNNMQEYPDYLQHTLQARLPSGEPLSLAQKRDHVTLLIQGGADSTGTALGSMIRFLLLNPICLSKARAEIVTADSAGLLSHPVKFEETRSRLPYFVACIKESLRLNPPGTSLYPRAAGKGGTIINGVYIPEGTEMTTNAIVVGRDKVLHAPDPEAYRPERWVEGEKRVAELEAGSFVWGMGARACLGKDVAVMELYKLLPEVVRRFDMELVDEGRSAVAGGVAHNAGLMVGLTPV
ncbi:Pisatin demethylase [Cladorrhinum sp. PSN332]|nr:Pisatin demethylase [Cladorrhinum sp. PSN332]